MYVLDPPCSPCLLVLCDCFSLTVLKYRILVQHIDKFNTKEVTWHIPSRFTKEMSQKSEVVSYLAETH